jgi:hypothetical protein
MIRAHSLGLLLLLCLFLGCQKDDIRTYRVPKESSVLPIPPTQAAHKELEWKTPHPWVEQAPSSMRVGSFLIKGPGGTQADVSIIPLTGEAGGDLANINRWRDQIGLGPLNEAELAEQSQRITPAGKSMRLIDFVNGDKQVIAAIHQRKGQSWFFKMTGDASVVRSAKTAFIEFLASVTFHEHS